LAVKYSLSVSAWLVWVVFWLLAFFAHAVILPGLGLING